MPLCLVGQFSPFTGGAQQTLFGAGIASFVGLFFSLIGASPILFGSCHGRSRHSQVAPLKGPRTTAQALFHPGKEKIPVGQGTGVSNAKLFRGQQPEEEPNPWNLARPLLRVGHEAAYPWM